MDLPKLMKKHRQEEMKAIATFIQHASVVELALIIEEIRVVHDCLMAWNEDIKSLDEVESIAINGESIQLNLKKG